MSPTVPSRLHCFALALSLLALPSVASALTLNDVAGKINGDPVTVAEVDRAAGDVATRTWLSMDTILRNAARAICSERIEQTLAESEGLDRTAWRARLWQATTPHEEKPPTPSVGAAAPPAQSPDAVHEQHVRAYRQRLASAVERLLEMHLNFAAPSGQAQTGEPALSDPVATCLGLAISPDDVLKYAAYPLYERRAMLVTTLCEQFAIDYEHPLVVGHVARAEGKSLEELLAHIEGDLGEIDETEVRRVASERFGRVDDMTLLRARLLVDSQRREDRRRAWIEKVRRETLAQCTLVMPDTPQSNVRVGGVSEGSSSALPLYYFGNFECSDCRAGWQMLRALRESYLGRIRIEFRNHFPETDARLFSEALEAECANEQGRFWSYGEWRTSAVDLGSAADGAGLDAAELAKCMGDAATAVHVLDETAEALRLGFREAVPSWVVGSRVRRGVQGQGALARDIDQQLAAAAAAPSTAQGGSAAGGQSATGPAPQSPTGPAPQSTTAAAPARITEPEVRVIREGPHIEPAAAQPNAEPPVISPEYPTIPHSSPQTPAGAEADHAPAKGGRIRYRR